MEVTISGRHVAVTDAMREHARQRVQRLELFARHLMQAKVTLSIEGERHTAEIVGHVRGKSSIVAKSQSHDMYLSIDRATERMEKQLHKLEDRFKDRREGTRKRSVETADASGESISSGDEETYEESL